MTTKKILIVNDLHDSFMKLLERDWIEINYQPKISKEEVLRMIPDYHGIVVRSKLRIDQELVEKARKLEFVARAGAGIDNIDESALKGTNIEVFNAPEGNRDAVGEHTIGMILNLFNHLSRADQEVKNGVWERERNRGIELSGKTVGIIGFGNTGQSLARKLSGFNVEVLAYDKYHADRIFPNTTMVSMETLQAKADIVSLHVPLTRETEFFADEEFLMGFSKNIFLINTSRGKVLSLKALAKCIEQGKVLGAGLDVLENEKLDTFTEEQKTVFQSLVKSGSVLFTPHVAGWTYESYQKISEVLAGKILKHYQELAKVV